jgi:NitT/TauT family transport system permease protein
MIKVPKIWGIHAEPPKSLRIVLALLPFVLLIAVYVLISHLRLAENPDDKLTPSLAKMMESMIRMAFTEDPRSGEYLLWLDTISSLKRLLTGLSLAAVGGLFIGINMGLFPGLRVAALPLIIFLSIIPPLSLLPILFIIFGADEFGKIMLIFLGNVFMVIRLVYQETQDIPKERIVKALTLGASQLQVAYQVILPQIFPKLLDIVRNCLGPAWLFLIAAEAIASTDGLGFRIFLVRRYLAMDVIIPYVLWITFLGYAMDNLLSRFIRWRYPWYIATR